MHSFAGRTAFSLSVPTVQREDAFAAACSLVEEWLARQAVEFGLGAPERWTIRLGNATAKLWSRRDAASFAFALSHKDDRAPAVEWHVLVGINKAEDRAHIEVEVAAEGSGPLLAPLAVPAFLPSIVERVGLADVWRLTSDAQPISIDNVRSFVELLSDSNRTLPVVAFSEPLPVTRDAVSRMARRIAGAAHVVLVDTAASFGISDRIGRAFSVYQGAVRVYPPKLSRNPYDIKLYFPATIQRYDEQGRPNGAFGTLRFADILARSALDRRMWPAAPAEPVAQPLPQAQPRPPAAEPEEPRPVAERPEVHEAAPFEASPVLSAIAVEAKQEAPTAAEPATAEGAAESLRAAELTAQIDDLRARNETLNSALESANDSWFNAQTQLEALQQQVSASQDLAAGALSFGGLTGEDRAALEALFDAVSAVKKMAERTAAAEAAAQQLRDENEAQRREIGKLQWTIESLQQRAPEVPQNALTAPANYRDVEALEAYLKGRHGGCIRLHQNARATLSEGLYEDSEHVVAMLELLGQPHHAMKTRNDDAAAYQAFHARKDELHLKYGPVLRETSLGDYGRHYEVTGDDGNRIGARDIGHIRDLGTTFAPERMAAIYFYWDAEREITVITAGPRKLPTPADLT